MTRDEQLSLFEGDRQVANPAPTICAGLLEEREHDRALLEGLTSRKAEQWASYLYARPRPETRRLNLREHAVALYDPFARRSEFPAGRRWCVNVFTGCGFGCRYCYIASYVRRPFRPRPKKRFRTKVTRDLEEIDRRGLHPAPLHISNSTDPLQHMERKRCDTLWLLRKVAETKHLFSVVTLLTKNPAILCGEEYLASVRGFDSLRVEVTCPFWSDRARSYYEPYAPSVESRLRAIEALRAEGIPVALRIDPLMPRDPLPADFFGSGRLADHGVEVGQQEAGLLELIDFAAKAGCYRVIVSPLKLLVGGMGGQSFSAQMRPLFAEANGGEALRRGVSYRLPQALFERLLAPLRTRAAEQGLEVMHCKDSLFGTV